MDIIDKRNLILNYRIRFAPEMTPIKETAIDMIIKRIIYIGQQQIGLTVKEIQNMKIIKLNSIKEIKESLGRLLKANIVIKKILGGEEKYILSDLSKTELETSIQSSEKEFKDVIDKLFSDCEDSSKYAAPFIEILGSIFIAIADEYIEVIIEKTNKEFNMSIIKNLIKAFQQKNEKLNLDYINLERAITAFFKSSNPLFDNIKWNLTQNYFLLKMIGMDKDGKLLSKELFEGTIFYLDTNVIFSALEPRHEHYQGFVELKKACDIINIRFGVCQISVDELTGLVANKKEVIKKLIETIPEKNIEEIRGTFYKIYKMEKESKGHVDIDKIFINLMEPIKHLKEKYGIEIVDDYWFGQEMNSTDTKTTAVQLVKKFKAQRGFDKNFDTAKNDALLLRWLKRECDKGRQSGLLTLDTSLPGFYTDGKPITITLDAFIQWIAPVTYNTDNYIAVFSEMLKNKILPKENLLDEKDFLILYDMNKNCKNLPAEDVEGFVKYLKFSGKKLNPSDPKDLIILDREMSRYMVDPNRKYITDMQHLEQQLKDRDLDIANLKTKISEKDEEKSDIKLRDSTILILTIALFIYVVFSYIIIGLKESHNEFVKFIYNNKIWVLNIGYIIICIIIYFVLGKKRFNLLSWPIKKLLNQKENDNYQN